jgi:hypothetical protein
MSNRITHIRKPNVNSSVEHITHVRGLNSKGEVFELNVPQVIEYLKNNYLFHVQVGNISANVIYQRSALGNEYIRTESDNTTRDNLLSLPQF